jgi:Domain of unknown function (DUF6265)
VFFCTLQDKTNTMKNKTPIIFAVAILAVSTAFKQQETNIKKAEWLLGRWENKMPEGTLSEIWRKVNNTEFHGESYFVIGKDTVFAESVVLDDKNGKMAYTVTVPSQNDAQPVRFDLTAITDTQMVFENPKHDFPNKIVYTQVKPDSLVAVIYGLKKGKPASETFAMRRIK